jgi:peptidyl-prolyl cis-trans isomerase D
MVNLLRKHQQSVMLVVTVVVIITFVSFWNNPTMRGGRFGGDNVGHIYDRAISLSDFQRGIREFDLCRDLGMQDLVRNLATDAKSMDEAQRNFIFNKIVLRHECDALGITAGEEEGVEAIKAMPVFQTNGGYDAKKYQQIAQAIGARGFTEQQILESALDELRLKKLKELIGTTVTAPVSEARTAFEKRNQMTELSFVRLKDAELAKDVTVTEDDLKKAFDERKLQTDEMRKVKFVSFLLTDEQKKLQGTERAAALQKLVDQASDFAVAMTAKDAKFEEAAQKAGAAVAETPEFALNDPPKELNESAEAAQAAFGKLTPEQPNSDAIRTEFGYYVLQLGGVTPARPLTFEEARPKLDDSLKKERVAEAAGLKATEIRNKIDSEMKSGKSFAEAAQAAGATVEQFPAFSLVNRPKMDQPGAREIVFSSMNLETGQLSEVIPIVEARLILHIDKRQPVDEAAFEKEKPMLVETISRSLRESAFEVWLAERRKLAKVQTARGDS